jgi:uncharacterized phage-like protein YoqJ
MRVIITGHREEKLQTYELDWIKESINSILKKLNYENGISIAYSGMASGVDLWFCESCIANSIPFIACIPFEDQEDYMSEESRLLRKSLLLEAKEKKLVKNSWMVQNCDYALVVWDGNKGGTHNVFQQLIENQIPFAWINPVSQKIWYCI